ncbi:MAG: 50S ribosomal protein L25/general stress protein Ctc [Syntrophobacteraceae bacterium]
MDIELVAQLRQETGKGPARRFRSDAKVPAVLYGPKTAPLSLTVPAKRLEKLLRDMGEESKLLRLSIEGGEERWTKQVLIREVQIHPTQRRFYHVDFYEVPMDLPIVVEVPVELQGESIGVKKGGVLNIIRRTLAVRCLPGEIPEKVQIDTQDLDLGGTVHVSDLSSKVPFELVDDPGFAVVNVLSPEGKLEAEGSEGEEKD